MIDASFDHNFNLLIQLKAARRQIAAFQSGDMFRRILIPMKNSSACING